jgi:uncharacterized protein YjdB
MKTLNNNKGSMIIWAPVVMLILLSGIASLCENSRLQSTAMNTRNAVQAAITQVCTDNTKNVYTGIREGYAGGYKLDNANWEENVSNSDIISKIDAKLGTSGGVKSINGKLIYKITDLSVSIKNAPLAPIDTDGVPQLTGTATFTLTVPLSFGGQNLPPMVINDMKVVGGYSPKSSLTESGGGSDQGKNATGISLSESQLTLEKGSIETLVASVSPEDATDSLSWVATNPSVCSVDKTGTIIAKSVGQSTIVATAVSGNAIAQCNVTVVTGVSGITLNKSNLSLTKGQSETLIATIAPADATNMKGTWASSDASVCTVDGNGTVYAVNAGTAIVTATTQDGSYTAQCTVTVTIPTTGISLDKTSLTLRPGASDTLTATVNPSNSTKATVLWASSNEDICTVDQTGKVIAVTPGSAIVSATTYDGISTATCSVTVTIPVTGVTLNKSNTSIVKGTSETLIATVLPYNATNKSVVWGATNSSIASVDQYGRVTGVGVGTTTIRVTTVDGSFSAYCTIQVLPNTYRVDANVTNGYVTGTGVYNAGSAATLTAHPDAHYHMVSWTNSSGVIVGYGSTYTIYNLSADTTVTANIEIDMFTVSLSAGTGGTVSGGGIYPYGTWVTIYATPDGNHDFLSWSDGISAANRSFTLTGDVYFSATFKVKPITWTSKITTSGRTVRLSGTENTVNYSLYSYVDSVKHYEDKDAVFLNNTYTFDNPVTFAAGSYIDLASYCAGKYSSTYTAYLVINGATVASAGDSYHRQSMAYYYFKSDTVVSTISVSITFGGNLGQMNSIIYVHPNGGNTFILNSSNTSAGQNVTQQLYSNSESETMLDVGASAWTCGDGNTEYLHSVGPGQDFYFINPQNVDHIKVSTDIYTEVSSGFSFALTLGDFTGQTKTWTSMRNGWANMSSDIGGYWNCTFYPETSTDLYCSGSIDSSCINWIKINTVAYYDIDVKAQVFLKDGTSYYLGRSR